MNTRRMAPTPTPGAPTSPHCQCPPQGPWALPKQREIDALAAERGGARPSAAAVRYAANVRDEVKAILRAEFKRELADELLK